MQTLNKHFHNLGIQKWFSLPCLFWHYFPWQWQVPQNCVLLSGESLSFAAFLLQPVTLLKLYIRQESEWIIQPWNTYFETVGKYIPGHVVLELIKSPYLQILRPWLPVKFILNSERKTTSDICRIICSTYATISMNSKTKISDSSCGVKEDRSTYRILES